MTKQEYQEALDWLFVQMPNYQLDGVKAYKPGLDNIQKLCTFFGNPQDSLTSIHVGGTNGKGSTSNMLASILQEQGYKVGLYNSPHLIDFTERIKVDGKNVDKDFVYKFINKLRTGLPEDIQPSFFEFTTIMAFEYFKEQNVDFAIIEVGLGGRLDSTNIITPILSIITNVAMDHMNILGNTLEEIATEKAGIIKKNIPIITGEENPIVKEILQQKATEVGTSFIDATSLQTDYQSDLKGNYQKNNIKVAVEAVSELRKQGITISDESLKQGLLHVHQNTNFIGRWHQFSDHPLTICDTGHNQAGLQQVFEQLGTYSQKKHIVLGFVNDKKIDDVIPFLPKLEKFYFVKPSISRGRDPKEYEELLKNNNLNYQIFNDVQSGYLEALKNCKENEMFFIGGSNFVVGEFLEKNLEVTE